MTLHVVAISFAFPRLFSYNSHRYLCLIHTFGISEILVASAGHAIPHIESHRFVSPSNMFAGSARLTSGHHRYSLWHLSTYSHTHTLIHRKSLRRRLTLLALWPPGHAHHITMAQIVQYVVFCKTVICVVLRRRHRRIPIYNTHLASSSSHHPSIRLPSIRYSNNSSPI